MIAIVVATAANVTLMRVLFTVAAATTIAYALCSGYRASPISMHLGRPVLLPSQY